MSNTQTTETRDYFETDEETGNEIPMRCHDCDRPAFYDYTDESYHHAETPEQGCFLIPAETA